MELINRMIFCSFLVIIVSVMVSSELVSFMKQEVEVCSIYGIPFSKHIPCNESESEREDSKEDFESFYFEVSSLLKLDFFSAPNRNIQRYDLRSSMIEIHTPPPETAFLELFIFQLKESNGFLLCTFNKKYALNINCSYNEQRYILRLS